MLKEFILVLIDTIKTQKKEIVSLNKIIDKQKQELNAMSVQITRQNIHIFNNERKNDV